MGVYGLVWTQLGHWYWYRGTAVLFRYLTVLFQYLAVLFGTFRVVSLVSVVILLSLIHI